MDAFNFVFSLYSILLGLALAQVLGGLGNVLEARGKVRLGWLTPMLGLFVILDLAAFWTVAWHVRDAIEPRYFILLYGLVVTGIYYLVARIVFPRDLTEWPDLDRYYFTFKTLTLGGVLLCNLLAMVGQYAAGYNVVGSTRGLIANVAYYPALIALILVRGRRANIALLAYLVLQYLFLSYFLLVTGI